MLDLRDVSQWMTIARELSSRPCIHWRVHLGRAGEVRLRGSGRDICQSACQMVRTERDGRGYLKCRGALVQGCARALRVAVLNGALQFDLRQN